MSGATCAGLTNGVECVSRVRFGYKMPSTPLSVRHPRSLKVKPSLYAACTGSAIRSDCWSASCSAYISLHATLPARTLEMSASTSAIAAASCSRSAFASAVLQSMPLSEKLFWPSDESRLDMPTSRSLAAVSEYSSSDTRICACDFCSSASAARFSAAASAAACCFCASSRAFASSRGLYTPAFFGLLVDAAGGLLVDAGGVGRRPPAVVPVRGII